MAGRGSWASPFFSRGVRLVNFSKCALSVADRDNSLSIPIVAICPLAVYSYFCIMIGVCWVPAYLGVGLSYRHGRLHKTFFFISPKCDFWAFQTISHIKRVFPYKFSGQPAERQDRFAGCRYDTQQSDLVVLRCL